MAGYDPESVIDYAIRSCKRNSSIESASLDFKNHFKNVAEAYVNKIRSYNYDYYLKHFKEFENLQVLFYGFESNNPKMIEVDFKISTKENIPINIKDSLNRSFTSNIKNQKKNHAELRGIGYTDEIKNMVDISSWKDPNIVTALYRLVKIECDSVPENVAEPIDVIIIDKAGHTWVNNPNKCDLDKK